MFSLNAYAKINWTLDILGTREDGYHLMDMLMQTISLHDTLTFTQADTITLHAGSHSDQSANVPFNEQNLVYKAAKKLQEYTQTQQGVCIEVQKNIPSGAGLGGGSADAAATLLGLNTFWNLHLAPKELHTLGLQLGADIPFLLQGGLSRVQGIGEIITPLHPAPRYWLVLLQPCEGLSTRDIFQGFDHATNKDSKHPNTEIAQKALQRKQTNLLCRSMHNVLQPISIPCRPAMQTALCDLLKAGAQHAMMTGSGSVVYGLFEDEETANEAHHHLLHTYDPCILCHTLTADASKND